MTSEPITDMNMGIAYPNVTRSQKDKTRWAVEPTFIWLTGLLITICVLAGLSVYWGITVLEERGRALAITPSTEMVRAHTVPAGLAVFFVAAASLFMVGLIPRIKKAPLSWSLLMPLNILTTACLNIGLLIGLRLVFYVWLLDRPYAFFSDPWTNLQMEVMRALTITFVISILCELFHSWRSAYEYRISRQINIKSGQSTLEMNGDDILFIKAAANYAEIHTRQGVQMVRATLQNLTDQFAEKHIALPRVHRSYLIAPHAVLSMEATRAGDCKMLLWDGTIITASRRYKPGIRAIERRFSQRKPS